MKTVHLTLDNTAWMLSEQILRRDDITKAEDLLQPPKIKADALVKFVKKYDFEDGDYIDIDMEPTGTNPLEELQFAYSLAFSRFFCALAFQEDHLDILRIENFYERRVGVGYCFLSLPWDLTVFEQGLRQRAHAIENLTATQLEQLQDETKEFREFIRWKYKAFGFKGLIEAVFDWEKKEQDRLTNELKEYKEKCKSCSTKLRLIIGKLGGYYSCPECKRTQLAGLELYTKCPNCNSNQVERILPNGKTYKSCKTYPKCREVSLPDVSQEHAY